MKNNKIFGSLVLIMLNALIVNCLSMETGSKSSSQHRVKSAGLFSSCKYTMLYGNDEVPSHLKVIAERCIAKCPRKKITFKAMNAQTTRANNNNFAFSINTWNEWIVWLNCAKLPDNKCIKELLIDHEIGHLLKWHHFKKMFEEKSWGMLGCASLASALFSRLPNLSLTAQSKSLQAASFFGVVSLVKKSFDASQWGQKFRDHMHKKYEQEAYEYAVEVNSNPEEIAQYLQKKKDH